MKTRAERRHENERMKARTVFRALNESRMDREHVTPAWVGKTAAVHWTCPCGMCTTALKHRKPDRLAAQVRLALA